jgi:hypothetical protein
MARGATTAATTVAGSTPPDTGQLGAGAPARVSDEAGAEEYYAVLGIVKDFDKNLLVVKGWGATVSTVTLAAGFEKENYGIFLVAALAGAAFWTIEATMKRHQMRCYVRMREIEYLRAAPLGEAAGGHSTPQIDWSWTIAPAYLDGKRTGPLPVPQRYQKGRGRRTCSGPTST